jgi:hypothetical protein
VRRAGVGHRPFWLTGMVSAQSWGVPPAIFLRRAGVCSHQHTRIHTQIVALVHLTVRECSDSPSSNERTNLENRLRAPKLLRNEWKDINYIIIYISDLKLFGDLGPKWSSDTDSSCQAMYLKVLDLSAQDVIARALTDTHTYAHTPLHP